MRILLLFKKKFSLKSHEMEVLQILLTCKNQHAEGFIDQNARDRGAKATKIAASNDKDT